MLNAGQNWFAHVYIAQEGGYDFVDCVKKLIKPLLLNIVSIPDI